MPYGVTNTPFPVLIEATKVQQRENKNKGIGGRILDFVIGSGTGKNVSEIEPVIEIKEKPDNTIYFVAAGVVVLIAGIYFFTRKKK